MGVFDDKKFDELDWLSQATEPIESKLNEILGSLPDTCDVDYRLICTVLGDSYFNSRLDKSSVIRHLMYKELQTHELSYKESEMLHSCFQLEVEPNTILDFENNVLKGKITLTKTKNTFEDKDLEKILGGRGIEDFSRIRISDAAELSRANEIMELLGKCEEGLRTRSAHRKQRAIRDRLEIIFKDNEWKIKDIELGNKVGVWIAEYIKEGNLASFSNFCRMKVMTHKGLPIYSMEEVK